MDRDRYEFGKNIADITEPRYVVERFRPTTVGIFVIGDAGYLRDTQAPTAVGEEMLRLAGEVERLTDLVERLERWQREAESLLAPINERCDKLSRVLGWRLGTSYNENLLPLLDRMIDGGSGDTVEALESEVRQLREMNQGHLGEIEALEFELLLLQDAREKGLSLGNAALKKGWEDCEKAVCVRLDESGLHLAARDIREGGHRPADFNAHAPSMAVDHATKPPTVVWTVADELTPEEVMARCDPFPAGLPEEDPEPESVVAVVLPPQVAEKLEAAARLSEFPGVLVVDLKPLLELAEDVAGHKFIHWPSSWILNKLREAGVIPGE